MLSPSKKKGKYLQEMHQFHLWTSKSLKTDNVSKIDKLFLKIFIILLLQEPLLFS